MGEGLGEGKPELYELMQISKKQSNILLIEMIELEKQHAQLARSVWQRSTKAE